MTRGYKSDSPCAVNQVWINHLELIKVFGKLPDKVRIIIEEVP